MLREVGELLLHLLHLLDVRHVLLNELLLRSAHLGDQIKLPILDVSLFVRGAHQLLLHGEIAHVLLFEGFNEKFNATFTILRLDNSLKFTFHQLFEV